MPRRTAQQAEETRAAILAAARKRFGAEGFNASLAHIVSDAGVTKGALFHHFPSKTALFREVWTDLQHQIYEEAGAKVRATREDGDPYAPLLAGAAVYLQWAAMPEYLNIVVYDGPSVLGERGWYEADPAAGPPIARRASQYLANRSLIDAGKIEAYAILIQAALNGLGAALARNNPDLAPGSALAAFETMLRCLR